MAGLSLACCGLDCSTCDIYQAAGDPAKAARLAQAFIDEGRAGARPDWFRCQGCRGPREPHWDADCWILACCTERGIDHCAQCPAFPCDRLEAWGRGMSHHGAAVHRLKQLGRGA